MTSASAAPGAPVSDDFHAASLNLGLWSVENPVGNGSVSVNGHALVLSVPAGSGHDTWSDGVNGLRVVQPVANCDFEVESKFESMGSAAFQDEGILVEQDASTVLRFDVYNAGGSVNLFAASVVGWGGVGEGGVDVVAVAVGAVLVAGEADRVDVAVDLFP